MNGQWSVLESVLEAVWELLPGQSLSPLLSSVLGWMALGLGVVIVQFALAALVIAWMFRPKPFIESPDRAGAYPPITLLIPCEGAETGLEARLKSALTAPYSGARQVIFCLFSAQDGAYPAIERVLAWCSEQALPDVEATVVFSQATPAMLNRKVRHLNAGMAQAKYEVIVSADSDVLFEAETLPALIATLLGPAQGWPAYQRRVKPGLAFAPPRFTEGGGLPDQLLAYGFSSSPHAFYVLKALADFTQGARPVVGSLMAFYADSLRRIGGYSTLGGHIGDDLELGRSIESLGQAVVVSPVTACCPNPELSWGALCSKLHRWIVVGGAYGFWRLLTYPTLLAPMPLLGLLTLGSLFWTNGGGLLTDATAYPPGGPQHLLPQLLLIVAVVRLGVGALQTGFLYQHSYQRRPRLVDPLLWALWELALCLCSLWALCSFSVTWRGRRLRILPGGGILPLFDPARPYVPEVPAVNNRRGQWLLPAYARMLTRSHLHAVWVKGLKTLPEPQEGALIFAANHACWWDGIVAYVVHKARIPREFFIVMEDKQLRKYQFFSWAGAFSIRRNHVRSAGQTLLYAEELLSDGGRAVWMFPQGVMGPEGRRPLRFEGGVVQLSRKREGLWVVPVALHYVVRAHPHPEAFVSLGRPLRFVKGEGSHVEQTARLEQAVTALLDELRQALDEIPLEAVPEGYEQVLAGRQGVAETWDKVRASVGLLPKEKA